MAAVWGYFSQISVKKKNAEECFQGARGILHFIYLLFKAAEQ